MLENPQSGSHGHDFLTPDTVLEARSGAPAHLAMAARRAVTVATSAAAGQGSLDPGFLQALLNACLSEQRQALVPVLAQMRAAKIMNAQIADAYLPAVAQLLGAGWCDDTRNFTQVTIGVARLQQLLPQLGSEWRAVSIWRPDAPSVLLVVGDNVDHSFGAKILAGQLRRKGLSVRLALGCTPADVRTLMACSHFDAVMISASVCDPVEPLRRLVAAVKDTSGPVPRVVIGGAICDTDQDLMRLTGADLATQDMDEALRFCGLSRPSRAPAKAQHRTVAHTKRA